jgi:multidrug efflux pump subunit AcrA (membrane-fusion protein)
LVIILGGVAFALFRPRSPQVTYQSQTVVKGDLNITASATGPIQGTLYNADFVATGRISAIDVSVGQHVTAGQTLAKLDATTLPGNTPQADATLTAPHAGTVTAINGAVGASSGVGTTGTHFIEIVDTSSLYIVANVTITTQSRTNVLLIPVSAVNFAQSAQTQGLISQSQVATALTQAHQQLSALQSTGVTSGTTSNPNPVTNDNPNPAYVLTSSNGQLKESECDSTRRPITISR